MTIMIILQTDNIVHLMIMRINNQATGFQYCCWSANSFPVYTSWL